MTDGCAAAPPISPTLNGAIAAATVIRMSARAMRLDISNLLTSSRSPRPLRCGRGARRGNSTAAAEAAGAAIAEVFLAVRAGRGRNGRECGEGQSEGQNNLGHRDLLLVGVMLSAADQNGRPP